MTDLPVSVRSALRRLARRVALGLFLDIWPRWAIGGLLFAGTVALVCRIFFAEAAGVLPWLWLVPILTTLPAIYLSARRRYNPSEIAALADSLSGGQGTLLTLIETKNPALLDGADKTGISALSHFSLPRWRPWKKLGPVFAAAIFLAVTLMVPQRVLTGPRSAVLANDVVADLKATLDELKKQDLLTPEEQKTLEEEIERIRKDALERMDASSWEAADSLAEKMAAGMNQKEDALKWAEESLARYASAAQAGAPPTAALDQELLDAIKKLAEAGMFTGAPEDLQQLLGGEDAIAGGKIELPRDPRDLRRMAASLAKYLGNQSARFGELRRLPREAGRFDPSEFGEFDYERREAEGGDPGSGGLSRGRGDADLTWGDESLPFDKFKSVALPPGSVRSPDDWSPVAVLPGAPKEVPEVSTTSTGVQFGETGGQAAWRRTLAPRHYSAVKHYFENSEKR